MTKLRAYATIFVLGIGAGMGVTFLTPKTADAPDRINPAMMRDIGAGTASAGRDTGPPMKPALAETPTVTVPASPLLRAATGTRPIDTTMPDVVPATVRHETPALSPAGDAAGIDQAHGSPASGSRSGPVTGVTAISISGRESLPDGTGRHLPPAADRSMLGAVDGEVSADPLGQTGSPATGPTRARATRDGNKKLVKRPEQRAPTSKRVETLFLNPLGVR